MIDEIAPGTDPLRDEDVARLEAARRSRAFFRSRNEYGPGEPDALAHGRRVAISILALLALVAAVYVLVGGVR